METFTKSDACVRTKRTWVLGLGVVGFVPVIGWFVTAILTSNHWGIVAYVGYLAAMLGLVQLWNRWWLARRGQLRADERGLSLDDTLIVARDSIRHGHLLRQSGAIYVRLGRAMRLVDVEVADDAEGEALLIAMRLDPARSVGQYPMNHGTYRSAWIRAGVFAVFSVGSLALMVPFAVRGHSIAALVLLFAVWGAGILAWAVNNFVRVAVGADGVRFRRLLGRARFLPFSKLESAAIERTDVFLRLRDGTRIEMHCPPTKKTGWWLPHVLQDRANEGQMFVDRVNAQIARHDGHSADLRVLARAGRETREWLREVALASDEHASFRDPAVPADTLWRVVEDTAAASTARAGAALALRRQLDDEGRTRLRVLADACAAPPLRVALQVAASTAEADALEEAFERVQDEEPRAMKMLRS